MVSREDNIFDQIAGHGIRWRDPVGIMHAAEAAEVMPGIRLLRTKCERDIPGGEELLGDDPVTCLQCLATLRGQRRRQRPKVEDNRLV